MRWENHIYNEYDQRTIRKFLLFPCTIGNQTRWLEKATIVQSYERPRYKNGLLASNMMDWINIGFKDFEGQEFISRYSNINKNNPPRPQAPKENE